MSGKHARPTRLRRTHLRGHGNILKRLLVHVAGFNLGLVMRALLGVGKPRRLQDGLAAGLLPPARVASGRLALAVAPVGSLPAPLAPAGIGTNPSADGLNVNYGIQPSSTGC